MVRLVYSSVDESVQNIGLHILQNLVKIEISSVDKVWALYSES